MLTFDCFPFFNELSLLELRLNELKDVVDYFVLVEAPFTHSGKPKPLYYHENSDRFQEFRERIVHVIVEDMPITPEEIREALSSKDKEWLESGYQKEDSWVRERFQRNKIMDGLAYAKPDDVVIIGDADEIVRASVVEECKSIVSGGNDVAIKQKMYSYYLNVECSIPWWGSKILLKKNITTPSEDRFHTEYSFGIENGGYHFNFMGGAEAIRYKIRSYAHQEYATFDNLFMVEERLRNLEDVFGRQDKYKVVPIDETYPKYLRDNLDKFEHLIYHGDKQ